ncbi:hypothetical protein KJ853_03220 [Patescibacteria group bacterium]|nr:hypothetical protein [Patescibacteria group bacterium]
MPEEPVQQKILVEDVQEGIVVLKGGDLRAVLMTSSTNFALKSTQEQDALIMKYQGFLNSLDFSIQILAISRQLDISDYLALLEQMKKEQTNELLKIQISEYVDFVKNLVQVSNIMSQSFFVVVPLAKVEKKEGGLLEKIGLFQKNTTANLGKSLDELKAQLWQRVEYIISGLSGLGLKAVPLNTQEITELFYHLYNMGSQEKPTFQPEETKQSQK